MCAISEGTASGPHNLRAASATLVTKILVAWIDLSSTQPDRAFPHRAAGRHLPQLEYNALLTLQLSKDIGRCRSVTMFMADLPKDHHAIPVDQKGRRISCLVRRFPAKPIKIREDIIGIDHKMKVSRQRIFFCQGLFGPLVEIRRWSGIHEENLRPSRRKLSAVHQKFMDLLLAIWTLVARKSS